VSARVVLVPGPIGLLPEYASVDDPFADVRAACVRAVGWLGRDVTVLADAQGKRVADHLLESTQRRDDVPSYLVVANGSGMRSGEWAPGYLDERGFAFDEELGAWLRGERQHLDLARGRELFARVDGFEEMADSLSWGAPVAVDYDGDPWGVQYWVMRWEV
jgi:hypothetical protein